MKNSGPATLREEIEDMVRERVRALKTWFMPKPGEGKLLQVGKFFLKLPLLILVIALSPVAAVILFIVFIATF
ncbi:MAG: hypothetical protein ACO1NW_12040 [Chitinophagaceae bacterium]